MPSFDAISFHEAVTGKVATFAITARLNPCEETYKGLSSVVDHLSSYEEEGVPLFPKVVVANDIDRVKMDLVPCEVTRIGTGPLNVATFDKALKTCAQLATGDWYIYAERKPDQLNYGLIRCGTNILTSAIEERLSDIAETPVLCIKQAGRGVVDVIDSTGNRLQISFSARRVVEDQRWPSIDRFVNVATRDVELSSRNALKTLLRRAFQTVVEKGHGTLSIVLHKDVQNRPDGLKEGMWLDQPTDLSRVVADGSGVADEERSTALRAVLDIASGMLMSDLITVFDTSGRIRGYRVYAEKRKKDTPAVETVGGARRQTIALLKSWCGEDMPACLMLSHDGAVEFLDHVG